MIFLAALSAPTTDSYNIPWFLYAVVVACLLLYALIEIKQSRRDHVISLSEATKWSVIYIGAALAFAIPIFIFIGPVAGSEYLGAWAIEKTLSLDNFFVISLIFASFSVHPKYQRRMLNYGIAGAIVFRLIFILGGLELLRRFEWVSIIFGIILLRAAWKAFQDARSTDHKPPLDFTRTALWRGINHLVPIHPKFDGHALTTVVNGRRKLTLMAAIIILIEITDIIFAVDSVPAVLAISPNAFIAYSSNVFALLGLRALFFVYQAIATKFWALSWALAIVLAWIGFKMIAAPLGFHLSVFLSLSILASAITGSILVSLRWPRSTQPLKWD